jgi:hypothetical protein
VSAAEREQQLENARRARFEAESKMIQGMNLDVRILARELYGREGRDLHVAVQAIDRITADLASLRAQLEAERAPADDAEPTRCLADSPGFR